MEYREFLKRTLTIAAIVVLLLGLWSLRGIFITFFLAAVLALVLSIPVAALKRAGLKHGAAVAVTFFATLALLILFILWLLPTLARESISLARESPEAARTVSSDYTDWRARQSTTLQNLLPNLDFTDIENDLNLSDSRQDDLSVADATGFVLPLLGNAANVILGLGANLAFIVVVTLFLLLDPLDYIRGMLYLIPPAYHKRALEVLLELRIALTAWMSALSLSMTITGVLVWFVLGVIIGVDNALAIAVIAALATVIPNVGVLIPLLPIAIFTLADGGVSQLLIALAAYIAIQQIEGNVITPSIVKEQLNIPAALVFTAQLVAAFIFGALGILLAVPLLAIVITLVRELYVYDTLGLRGVDIRVRGEGIGTMTLIRRRDNKEPVIMLVSVIDEDDSIPVLAEAGKQTA